MGQPFSMPALMKSSGISFVSIRSTSLDFSNFFSSLQLAGIQRSFLACLELTR